MISTLSPADIANALGCSESTIRRWCDRGQIPFTRTTGGHRRMSRQDVLRFARESQLPVIRPDVLEIPSDPQGALQGRRDSGDALYRALCRGDEPLATSIIEGLYAAGCNVAEICDGPVREAMGRIGALWPEDKQAILVEHRATNLCSRIMVRLRSHLPATDNQSPKALGGAPSGDPYLLPAEMAGTVLSDVGFADVNLGADTPLDVINAASKQLRPRLVWLSLTADHAPKGGLKGIHDLARKLKRRGTHFVVGGRAARTIQFASNSHVHVFDTLQELAGFARGVIAESGKRS